MTPCHVDPIQIGRAETVVDTSEKEAKKALENALNSIRVFLTDVVQKAQDIEDGKDEDERWAYLEKALKKYLSFG